MNLRKEIKYNLMKVYLISEFDKKWKLSIKFLFNNELYAQYKNLIRGKIHVLK